MTNFAINTPAEKVSWHVKDDKGQQTLCIEIYNKGIVPNVINVEFFGKINVAKNEIGIDYITGLGKAIDDAAYYLDKGDVDTAGDYINDAINILGD